jgi:hypothetical protein
MAGTAPRTEQVRTETLYTAKITFSDMSERWTAGTPEVIREWAGRYCVTVEADEQGAPVLAAWNTCGIFQLEMLPA